MKINILEDDRDLGHILCIKESGRPWGSLSIGQSIEEVELVVDELTLYLEQIKQPTAAELDVSWPSSGVEG